MKTPQKFVVEFKSGRRRADTRSGSIWGNTDIKALLLAAEEDAPHLFDTQAAQTVSVARTDVQAEAGHQLEQAEVPTTRPERPAGSAGESAVEHVVINEAEVSTADPVQDDGGKVDLGVRNEQQKSAKQSSRKRPVAHKSDRKGKAEAAKVHASSELPSPELDVLVEDLDALAVENLRLKKMLAAELRQQNLQLLKLLRRFP